MKILEEYPTKLLTNFELLCLLRERHSERNSASSSKISDDRIGGVNDITSMKYLPKNVAFIEYQLLRYLEESACARAQYTSADITKFLEETSDIPLTKLEKLQILDLRPSKTVELLPLIDELEKRFANNEHNTVLLEKINRLLPLPPPIIDSEYVDEDPGNNDDNNKQ